MYSLLWKAARPFLRRHKRLKDDFAERLVPLAWPFTAALQSPAAVNPARPGEPFELWLQAASGGESYLAWELLKELAVLSPGLRALCTTCTRQGLEVLRLAQQDPACAALRLAVNYLPLDEKAVVGRAVERVFGPAPRPAGALLALLETEIWPGLLSACARAGVPGAIINARLTERSFAAYRWFRPWLRRLAPAAILATAEGDLKRFCRVFDRREPGGEPGCEPVRALMPNLKFDRLYPLEERPAGAPAATAAGSLPPGGLLLLASTRAEEESALLAALPRLLAEAPDSALALAPRHLHRVQAWQTALDGRGISYRLRSACGALSEVAFEPGRVLLWDVFGELGGLYRLASAVFVGGSLAPLGGQNFLEALAAGLVPCIGPYWSNFYWAGEQLFSRGLARRLQSGAELAPALLELLRRPRPKDEIRREFEEYLAPRRGGARQAAALIARLLARDYPEAAHGR